MAFQELLSSTQTLQTMSVVRYYFEDQELNELQTAAVTLGFANNTTLRDLESRGWREADLAPVMTALRDHPALQKILFRRHDILAASRLSLGLKSCYEARIRKSRNWFFSKSAPALLACT
jgi:hypothetical protein